MASSMAAHGSLQASERVNLVEGSRSAQNMRRHQNLFGRAIGASRDLFHTTKSRYRRDHVSELASTTIEPSAWPRPPSIPASNVIEHDRDVKLARREGRVDMAVNVEAAVPNIALPVGERQEEQTGSFHRTRPLSPEGGARSESMPGSRRRDHGPTNDRSNPLSPTRPGSFKRLKTSFSIPTAVSTNDGVSVSKAQTPAVADVQTPSKRRYHDPSGSGAETATEIGTRSSLLSHAPLDTKVQALPQTVIPSPLSLRPSLLQQFSSRPEIPVRKDSLPAERHVLQDLVDQTVRSGDFCDARQSVTAYVSAEYSSDLTHPSILSSTSWLSDPDGPPDDLVSWNQPVTSRRDSVTALKPQIESLLAPPRPSVGLRSKSSPIYSNTSAPQEQSDAQYDRILREKLRHHAGQVKKRLDTSTYYSPTVRQREIEVHLAFVRAAEEILKQSPIWHGSSQAGLNGSVGGVGMDKEASTTWLLYM